jgi:hypothetical protein
MVSKWVRRVPISASNFRAEAELEDYSASLAGVLDNAGYTVARKANWIVSIGYTLATPR